METPLGEIMEGSESQAPEIYIPTGKKGVEIGLRSTRSTLEVCIRKDGIIQEPSFASFGHTDGWASAPKACVLMDAISQANEVTPVALPQELVNDILGI